MADSDLLFTIKANGAPAVAEIQNTAQAINVNINNMVNVANNATKAYQNVGTQGSQAFTFLTRSITGSIPVLGNATNAAISYTSAIGIAGGAIGGFVALVTGAAAAVYKLADAEAEYGAHLKDISVETGISTETLSAFALGAKLAGSSLDQAQRSLDIYLRNASEAAHGNEKLSATFQRFGLDAKAAIKNPDQALQDLLTRLAAIPNESERLDAAFKLAGRSGALLARIAGEMGGNFDELKRKADELGISFSEGDAQRAKDFEVALTLLEERSKGLAYTFGKEVGPEITKTLDDWNAALGTSGDAWEKWSFGIAGAIATARGAIEGAREAIREGALDFQDVIAGALIGGDRAGDKFLQDRWARERADAEAAAKANEARAYGLTGYVGDVEHKDRTGDSAARKAAEEAKRALEAQQRGLESLNRELARATLLNDNFGKSQIDAAVATMRANSGIEKLTGNFRAAGEEALKSIEIQMRDLDAKKELKKAEDDAAEQKVKDADFYDRVNRMLGDLVGTEEKHLDKVKQLIKSGIEQNTVIDIQTAKLLKLLATVQDIDDAAKKAGVSLAQAVGVDIKIPEVGPGYGKSGPYVDPLGLGKAPPPNFKPIKSAIGDLKSYAVGAFNDMAKGFGQMVGQWVLTGDLGGQSLKKLTATLLSEVATQAASQAIMFTAYGLAALTPWGAAIYGPATQWFEAAALMAAVAAGSAVVGRAVAGDSFSSGASPAVAGNAYSSPGGTNTTPTPIIQGRPGGSGDPYQPQHLIIEVKPTDAFVVNAAVKDYRGNGRIRKIILHGAGELATI
jgi:hypothetical protein